MKLISLLILVTLAGCNSFLAHKDDLKPMAHDMVDEELDGAAELIKQKKESKEVKHD